MSRNVELEKNKTKKIEKNIILQMLYIKCHITNATFKKFYIFFCHF